MDDKENRWCFYFRKSADVIRDKVSSSKRSVKFSYSFEVRKSYGKEGDMVPVPSHPMVASLRQDVSRAIENF